LAVGSVFGAFIRYKITESPLIFNTLPLNVLIVNIIGAFILGARMKKLRIGILSAVTLVLAIILIFYVSAASPLDAAKARCALDGWPVGDLTVLEYSDSNGLFGGQCKVNIRVSIDPPKTLHAELRRPAYSRQWRIVTFQEGSASIDLH